MDNLSNYIKRQLSTIISQSKITPPRKNTSLSRIRTLVKNAPIQSSQKKQLNQQINRLETVIKKSKSYSNPYAKQLFYQKMLTTQKVLCQANKHSQHNSGEFNRLLNKLEQLRGIRISRENYLCQLMVKAQRLSRLVQLKKNNNQRYLKTKLIQKEYQQKSKVRQQVEKRAITAAKKNNRKTVHSLVHRYTESIQ